MHYKPTAIMDMVADMPLEQERNMVGHLPATYANKEKSEKIGGSCDQ